MTRAAERFALIMALICAGAAAALFAAAFLVKGSMSMEHYEIELTIDEQGQQPDPAPGDLLFFEHELFVLTYRPASKAGWAAQRVGSSSTWNGWQETAEEATIDLGTLPVGSTAIIKRWRGR